jgi:hypothetical protein
MRFLAACLVLSGVLTGCGGGSGSTASPVANGTGTSSPDGSAATNSVGVVTIEGEALSGQVLSASVQDADGFTESSLIYLWMADGEPVAGASERQFQLTSNQVGAVITVAVTYTDSAGFAESLESTATTAVVSNDTPELIINDVASIAVIGSPQVGQRLTAVVTDLNGVSGVISYQWLVDGVAIIGANTDSYAVTAADIGAEITASASFTDDEQFAESPLSDSVGIVTAFVGLDPNVPPGQNFDLLGWKLDTPEESSPGLGTTIGEVNLSSGYTHPEYFWTADDGGMVFRVTNAGGRTSSGTMYPRTELREMLRRGQSGISTRGSGNDPSRNNWVFSSAPASTQALAGGVDGELKATLAMNAVTTTGATYRIGRLVVGQIHAKDDEPLRLYYRKLPGNQRGSVYAAHEINGGDDIYYEIVGSRSSSADDPENGIALNELWSYEILAVGNQLTVTIRRGDLSGETLGIAEIDMTESGYSTADEFMYFKAGAYNGNNDSDGGLPNDFSQVTFYHLTATHN